VINTLQEVTNMHLGELNAFSSFVPDVYVFIRMHTVKEAIQTSRIAGTRTRMDEAILEAKYISPESRKCIEFSCRFWNESYTVCRQEYSGIKPFLPSPPQSHIKYIHPM